MWRFCTLNRLILRLFHGCDCATGQSSLRDFFLWGRCSRHSASLHAGLSTIAPPALSLARPGWCPQIRAPCGRRYLNGRSRNPFGLVETALAGLGWVFAGKSLRASAKGALPPSYMNGARSCRPKRRGRRHKINGNSRMRPGVEWRWGRAVDGADQEIGAPWEGKGAHLETRAKFARNGRRAIRSKARQGINGGVAIEMHKLRRCDYVLAGRGGGG